MKIALVCSAEIQDYAFLKQRLLAFPQRIAVDGGANHFYSMGLVPDLIIGDLDSIQPSLLEHFKGVPIQKFPEDKDHTDLELAINAIDLPAADQVVVFGALGERLDHTLGNLTLLSRYPGKLSIESEKERCFVIDRFVELEMSPGQVLSLIPLNGPACDITTTGLKWELNKGKLNKYFLGISNEALGHRVAISVGSGDLLCVIYQRSSISHARSFQS